MHNLQLAGWCEQDSADFHTRPLYPVKNVKCYLFAYVSFHEKSTAEISLRENSVVFDTKKIQMVKHDQSKAEIFLRGLKWY